MPFAVKLKQNEVITLSSTRPLALVITNITLDPSSEKAHLLIRSKQDQEQILIAQLRRETTETFACSIQLTLGDNEVQELICKEGEIHLIGNVKESVPSESKTRQANSLIQIVRTKLKEQQCQKRAKKKQKVKPTKTQKSNSKEIPLQKPKKINLLQLMNNVADDQDEDQSDDCYQAEEDEEESSSSSQQSGNKETVVEPKKKISWAAMLQGASNEEQDGSYSEQNQESDSEDEQDEEQPIEMKKGKKKRKIDPQQKLSHVCVNKEEKEEKETKSKRIVVKSDSESSSFQFQTPKELPSFVKKQ